MYFRFLLTLALNIVLPQGPQPVSKSFLWLAYRDHPDGVVSTFVNAESHSRYSVLLELRKFRVKFKNILFQPVIKDSIAWFGSIRST